MASQLLPPLTHQLNTPVGMEGWPVVALLDSGSTITLVWPSVLLVAVGHYSTVKVTCVHEDA